MPRALYRCRYNIFQNLSSLTIMQIPFHQFRNSEIISLFCFYFIKPLHLSIFDLNAKTTNTASVTNITVYTLQYKYYRGLSSIIFLETSNRIAICFLNSFIPYLISKEAVH